MSLESALAPPAAAGGAAMVAGGAATASDAIAQHAASVRFSDLDASTIAAAKLRILDVLGCALGGTRGAGSAALLELAETEGGRADATLAGGRGAKVAVGSAAMTNAILARSFDYEVMGVLIEGRLIPSHHAATTVPTALALCEGRGLGGRDLLTAVVVGDDIAARTLAASGLDFGQGWDGSATYAALGATAAAGHLIGLAPRSIRHALGLVVNQIGGTIQSLWDGATDFKLGQGTAARNAVLAAELAARGWTGMDDPLLGRFGFYSQYTAGCSDPGILVRDLGHRYWAEAYFKPHPACMATHVCIEAAQRARAEPGGFDTAAIEHVSVRLPAASLGNFCGKPYEPRATAQVDAIFSYPHMVATALLRGGIEQTHHADAMVRDPDLLALVAKVVLEALPAGETGAEVVVTLRDGTLRRGRALAPRRSPLVEPATADEIADKFHRQVAFSGLLDRAQAERLRALVDTLDGPALAASLRPLAELLGAAGAAP